MNKKFLFVFCLIIFISSMACVSASEDFNQINIEDTYNADGDILSISPGENEIVGADAGTFTQLQEMINGTQAGSSVNLNTDYEYDSEFSNAGIIIDKPLTINGNGKVLDAKGASRIFQITATGNVILNNITFKNGYFNGNGGAIYVPGDLTDSTFENLKFVNNTAKNNGGALYFYGQSSGILFDNVMFENNVAQCVDSGAINFHGKMTNTTFNDVTFYNNSAKRMGAATSHSMGGAVNIDNGVENCLFNNTFFIQNTAKNSAGALSINGIISALTFENTRFINNTAELEDGGAIHIGPWKESNLAGATFKNVTFDGNNANNNGGALYVTGETSSNIFKDVKFINNTAKTANGGALYLGSKNTFNAVKNTFENVSFEDNTANSNGGAIYVTGKTSSNTFKDVKFTNNIAKTSNGGAICLGTDNLLNSVNTFENVTFEDNIAYKNGGALYIRGPSSSNEFKNVNFTNNVAQYADSGAVNFYGKISGTTFDNVIFYNNSAKGMGSSKTMGGAVNIDNGVENCLFNNTFFIQNTAKNSAGALSINGKISALTFENTNFINNTAELEDGGAISVGTWKQSNLAGTTFKNVTFDGNTAKNSGGAVYVTGASSSNTFEDVRFLNNIAQLKNGGAMMLGAKNTSNTVNNTFEDVVFAGNAANSSGGAIYVTAASSSNSFEKTAFISNTGQNVVYINQSDSDNSISDSIFVNNDKNKIAVGSGTVQMTDDWFGNNATNYNEMPDAEIVLDNWLFLNATANPDAITINQASTVTFKLSSYNKGNVEEYDGPMNILLALSSTLGSLNQNYTLIDEDILYTASERGYGSVTGKFENAYYTVVLKNQETSEINVINSTLELEIGDEVSTGATLIPAEAGDLNYTSSNESVAVVDNGQIIALNQGTATITVSFEGNDEYAAAENKTISVTVKDSYRNITAEELIKFYGSPEPFVVNVTNSRGEAVVGESVSITINGVKYSRITDGNGTVRLSINLDSGDYPVNITVGNYAAYSYVHIMPTIIGNDVKSEFRNVAYVVYVLDSEGQFLENGTAVECNINGKIYTAYVNEYDGEATADLILNSGNYTITATNPVTNEKISNTIAVNAKNPSIDVSADSITEGENATVTVTLPEDATGTVAVGNEEVPVVNGIATAVLTGLPAGNNTIPVDYSGDNKYNSIATEVNVTVIPAPEPKKDLNLNATIFDIIGNATLIVSGFEDATGNVTITIGEDSYTAPIMMGTAFLSVPKLNETVMAYIYYPGDDNYNNASTTVEIIVKKDLNLTTSADPIYIGQNATIIITGFENATGNVMVIVGKGVYNASIIDGGVTVIIPGLNKTTVAYVIYTGDDYYNMAYLRVNITVNPKENAKISIDAPAIGYGDNATVTVILPEDATGNVTVGNEIIPVVNGTAGTVLTGLPIGNTTVPVTYSGDGKYNPIETEFNVTVKDWLYFDDAPVYKEIFEGSGNFSIRVVDTDVEPVANITVKATIDGIVLYAVSDSAGLATFDLSSVPAGNYTPVVVVDDDKYVSDSSSFELLVKEKENATIVIDASEVTEGEHAIVTVTLPEDAKGTVTVDNRAAHVVNGTATVILPRLPVGNNTVPVIYSGDDKYNAIETQVNITVNPKPKENATISIDAPSQASEGDNVPVTVILPEDATGNVTVGNEIIPVVNGTARAVLTDIPVGNNTVPVTYSGDDKYNPIETNITISVKEDTSDVISAPDLTVYYGGSERFVVRVTDYKGNPLPNKSVSIVINGVPYSRTTNANGTTSIPLGLPAGVYNVTTTMDNETVNSVVTILTTVNGTDIVKVFRNATQYYATFLDSKGNYLPEGTEVEFNINGIMYNRRVTQNGLAKLNINLQQGEYIITALNKVTGEMSSNNITVIPKIVENNDLTKYYRNASQYTVKLIGDDGNPVGAGESVVFNINGVMYTRTTNASGIAKMNINLNPGDYIITAEYKGCKVSNSIRVFPVIFADDITMKYRDGSQFYATVVDGQGKPYAGQDVQFNINGVLYNRITDVVGQAALTINLMPGKYIITSSYNGENVANTITITD